MKDNNSQSVSIQSISIISACRNEIRHMRGFLDSLAMQDMNGMQWEAIIADGMSTDGTTELLQEYCKDHSNVRVISNPGRFVSSGLNAAIRMAQGEIVLRMDAHTSYAPDYCRRSVETLLETGADNVGGPARTKAVKPMQRAIAAAYHSRFSTGGARFHQEGYEGWVDTVTYGCWKKTTLERIGLFDENLVRNQDDELNLRLIRAGGRIWQNPAIVSWYSPRSTVTGLFNQYFQYGFWKVIVIQKHRLPASWRHLVPAAFVAINLALLAAAAVALIMRAWSSFYIFGGAWVVLAAGYGVATAIASLCAARRNGWETLVRLPLIFGAYHLSYGFGFLVGTVRAARKPSIAISSSSVFGRITR
jgi:succinoglycan biosynthesis protein ExoA